MSVFPNFTGTGPTPLPKPVMYAGTEVPVRLGDHVVVRRWLRKRRGRVNYVPGESAFRLQMEYNGLSWVGVLLEKGWGIGVFVDTDSLELKKSVVFVSRGSNDVVFRTDEDL